jgi:organic radical activating enzyme
MTESLIHWRNKNLNSISPSFCAAKWYNASIHLGSGYTGSCHLPLPHLIDQEEIKNNPSALHNTKHKKDVRKMMLEGKRPAECGYCWKIEDIARDNVSDRIYKSNIYSQEDIEKLKTLPWDADVDLKTLEISFDRQCNFACSYCSAGYSTTWSQDLNKYGPYQNFIAPGGGGGAYQTDGDWAERFGKHFDENPNMQAFFAWWPKLSQTLTELRITGGEATVSQNFWRFVALMHNSEARNMRFAVNSNMGMSEKALEKLISITHSLPIKEFDLFTSNESFGAHAEYIRDGLIYPIWKNNLVTFLDQAKYRVVTIMMTINQLCLFSITDFIDEMIELKSKYGVSPHLSFNMLRWPAFMSPVVLPDDIKNDIHKQISIWFDKNKNNTLLSDSEKAQIQRLLDYIEVVEKGHGMVTEDKSLLFYDFKSFFSQYDLRRNKNLVKTFPQLKDWYQSIKLQSVFEMKKLDIRAGISPHETGEYKP